LLRITATRRPTSLELVLPSLLPACAIALPTYFTGLARERQMATLFITHDLALAVDHCDRIVVMHAGHAVESAATRALV